MFTVLLDQLHLSGTVVSTDAMHTQVDHARYLRRHLAHYILPVKANQPRRYQRLAALPWKDIPTAVTSTNAGHGRVETRTLQISGIATGIGFPHAKLAMRITRDRAPKFRRHTPEASN